MPTTWYNIVADLPAPPPPPLHPGRMDPVGPDDLAPLFPMDLIMQEVSSGAVHRHPRGRAGRLPPVAPLAALPCPPAGEGAGHPGADLLQVRGCLAGRLAQDEHLGAAGLLQQEGGHHQAHDGDRRRPVGHGARLRLRALRHRVRGVAGRRLVRREALSAPHDGGVRRPSSSLALGHHGGRPGTCRRPEELVRLSGHRDLGGRRGRCQGSRTLATRSDRCSTTSFCTRRSSARRPCCRWRWPGTPRP